MGTFNFKNKYDQNILFEFSTNDMQIKEEIGTITTLYKFNYNDIVEYTIMPNQNGYYNLLFYSNGKNIQKWELDQVKYTDYVDVSVLIGMKDSVFINQKIVSDAETDIRLVIYNNTPLRSQLDKAKDAQMAVSSKYENTPDNEFGMIYLQGPGRNLSEYTISINNTPFFIMYSDNSIEKLKSVGEYTESLAKPYWVDNNTIAFRIPFGKWNINYHQYNNNDHINRVPSSYQKSVDIEVNSINKEIKIKKKMGLFSNKLIQLK